MNLAAFASPDRPSPDRLLDFSGRVVCVTGARKGLGQGLAIRFAQAGADLIVHVRRAGDEAETLAQLEPLGGRVAVAVADLEDEPAVSSALEAAASKLGGLDVVVNNAGAYPVEPIEDLAGDRFDAVTRANLGTAFRVTRWCAARWRLESRAGAIVNVSSVEATRPAFGHAHYASAKAALEMLTRVTAVELASGGIRVNAVAPGLIHYPELVELWPEGVARYRDRALLGREGDRMEVADACLFLASPAASWVTGTVLTVDGGVSAAPHF